MSIEITTTKFVQGRTRMRYVTHVKALMRRDLPADYLRDSRAIVLSSSGMEIVKANAMAGTGSVIKKGESLTEDQFQDALEKLRGAGKLLHDIQEEGRQLEKEWCGRDTYII